MRTAVKIAMFNAQREKAIRDAEQRRVNRREQMAAEGRRRDEVEKCYRVYDPPQIHELSHDYLRGGN